MQNLKPSSAFAIGILVGMAITAIAYTLNEFSNSGLLPSSSEPPLAAAPLDQSIKIISSECPKLFGRHVSDITIVNTSNTAIRSLRSYVNFKDSKGNLVSASDGVFEPYEIPPNSRASAHVIPKTEGGTVCEFVAIQDSSGNKININ